MARELSPSDKEVLEMIGGENEYWNTENSNKNPKLVNVQKDYNLVATLINGAGAGIGFTLAIVLFAGIRERLELADIPEAFQGFPITLIAASLMSIAFLGFTGLIKL